jgi:hypothetical protein
MDGSRIEGSHKAWNSLQRAQPSGIEVYSGLAHDFFLRRNIRVASSRINHKRSVNCSAFIASAHTSHHVQLVNYTANLFNSLYEKEPLASRGKLTRYPTLPQIQVDEMIGLVESAHSVTFGGLLEAKVEASDLEASILLEDIDAEIAETDQAQFIQTLGIDENLISVMMTQKATIVPDALPSPSNISLSGKPASIPTPISNPPSNPAIPSGPSQKRKERAPGNALPDLDDHTTRFDDMPNSKRRCHTGPLSPSTMQLSLLDEPSPDSDFSALNETPEPYSGVSYSSSNMLFFDHALILQNKGFPG